MQALDIVIISFGLIGAFLGFKKGLLVAVVKLFLFAIAIVLGVKLMDVTSVLITQYFGQIQMVRFVSFVLIFLLTVLSINIALKLMKSILNLTPFGLIDNVLGAFFNAFLWFFALSIGFWALNLINAIPVSLRTESIFYPYIIQIAPFIFSVFGAFLPFFKSLFINFFEA